MSDSHPSPNNPTQATESGFLFNDWESPEETIPFDGKIIARMPDLGSSGIAQNSETSKPLSYWEKLGLSIASMIQGSTSPSVRFSRNTRQRFFLRLTTFGGIVLLCGVGLLFLEWRESPNEHSNNTATIVSDNAESSLASGYAVVVKEDFIPVVIPSESNDRAGYSVAPNFASPAAPVGNVAAVPPPPANIPVQAESVWTRGVANEYSPWDVAPRQSESPTFNAAGVPPAPVAPTVAMSPMIDMTMPVSPYEQQLLAQANSPTPVTSTAPVQPPVDPFIQTNNCIAQGMIPMHDRQENVPGVATSSHNVRPPTYPQYVPQSALQGMHAQYSRDPYPAPQPNMPIPSGASTLPSQTLPPQTLPLQGHGGYYHQPNGTLHSPDGYYNAPSPYRRVY